ncbi:MAG: hypothetical protein H7832_09285 [Magnetococcus sp. DMHC-6]
MNNDDDDFDERFKVVQTHFSPEDDQIYDAEMAKIRQQVENGTPWSQIVTQCQVVDKELRAIILDDFLKMTLATRHFQGGESIKQVAKLLQIPFKELLILKENMLQEVQQAAVKVYHLSTAKEAVKH